MAEQTPVASGGFQFSRRWMLVAPALLVLWIIGQIDKTHISLIIASEPFIRELNLAGHNAELGGLMSYFLLGYGIAIFLWGFLVDRFGPRICAIAGIVCWAVCLFLSAQVTSIGQLLALRFFLGAAEGNLWPVGNALTNRWFPAHEHSRAQAFWVTGSSLGTAIGVPIVTHFVLTEGWRETLVYLAIISLLPVLFMAFIADRPRRQKGISVRELEVIETGQKNTPAIQSVGLSVILKTRNFWLIMFCQFVAATSIFTLVQWIPRFLTTERHLSFRSMGNWIALGYVLATVLTFVICYIADRTMQRALTGMWICISFAVVVLPVAFLLPPLWTALLLSTLIVIATTTASLNGALMHSMVRPEVIARGTGIYVGIGNCMAGLGPLAFGYLITRLGGQFWGGFLFLVAVSLLGAVCYFTLYRISARSISAAVATAPAAARAH
ncbi:MAG: MFS transporter [Acidobacteria bacterium]|nr:MFS transporter [Acidobacteriota bacterium]